MIGILKKNLIYVNLGKIYTNMSKNYNKHSMRRRMAYLKYNPKNDSVYLGDKKIPENYINLRGYEWSMDLDILEKNEALYQLYCNYVMDHDYGFDSVDSVKEDGIDDYDLPELVKYIYNLDHMWTEFKIAIECFETTAGKLLFNPEIAFGFTPTPEDECKIITGLNSVEFCSDDWIKVGRCSDIYMKADLSRHHKPYTYNELEHIFKYYEKGLSVEDISLEMGRTPGTLRKEINEKMKTRVFNKCEECGKICEDFLPFVKNYCSYNPVGENQLYKCKRNITGGKIKRHGSKYYRSVVDKEYKLCCFNCLTLDEKNKIKNTKLLDLRFIDDSDSSSAEEVKVIKRSKHRRRSK